MNRKEAQDLALLHAHDGYPVIPIRISKDGKKPLTEHGYKDATTDPATIIKLFRSVYVDHKTDWEWGVGIVPGPANKLVVDLDRKNGKDGFQSILALEKANTTIPRCRVVITPSGGLHWYFTKPQGVEEIGPVNPASGIDIRCDKSYAVAPGTHTIFGRYEFEPDTLDIKEDPELPTWLLDLITSTSHKAWDGEIPDDEPLPAILTSDVTRHKYVEVIDGVRRHVQTLQAVKDCLREGLTHGQTLTFMRDHNPTWSKITDPTEGSKSFEQFVMETIVVAEDQLSKESTNGETPFDQQSTTKATSKIRLVSAGDWALDEPEITPAIWGQGDQVTWAEGEPFMIVGDQGVGKTTIIQQLMLYRIGVLNGEFLGLPVKLDNRPILYLAMDRPRQAARSLRRMITEGNRSVINDRIKIWQGPLPFTGIDSSPNQLMEWVTKTLPNCGLVVADSVKDFCPGVSKDDIGSALNIAWQGLIATGVEVVLLHHFKKPSQGSKINYKTLEYVYGSTWLTAGCGSVINIEGNPGDLVVKLHHAKQPSDIVGPLVVEHDHRFGISQIHDKVGEISIIRNAGTDGITAELFANKMWGEATANYKKRARRRLIKLEDDGTVRRHVGTPTSGHGREPDRWSLRADMSGLMIDMTSSDERTL